MTKTLEANAGSILNFFRETGTKMPNKPATIIFKIIATAIKIERSNSWNQNWTTAAEMIAKIFQFDGEIIWDKTKPKGQVRKPSDNSKLKSYLPDFEFTPIDKGIEKTVEWFLNNYKNIRKWKKH